MTNEKEPRAERLPANAEHAAPASWDHARQRLSEGQWYWLGTVGPDGQPQVRPVLAVWMDGAMFFVAGPGSRKARNLIADPRCTITLGAEDAHLVVEGEARKVDDETKLKRISDVYLSKYEWPTTVRGGAFWADYGAPTAGPPPYDVYELKPTKVFGFGTGGDYSPTRWTFTA